MAGHILWGKIESEKSLSHDTNSKSCETPIDPNSAANPNNNEKLRLRNIDLDDVTQLSSDAPSSATSSKVVVEEQQGAADDDSQSDWSEGSDEEEKKQQQIQKQREHMQSLQNVDIETLKKSIPLDSDGNFTSLGSAGHASGNCKVCLFAHSKAGCTNGMYCNFCHHYHKRPKRKNKLRPSKGKRDRYRKLVQHLTGKIKDQPDTFDMNTVELPPSIASSEAMKSKLFAKLLPFMEQAREGGAQASGSSMRPGGGDAAKPARSKEIISI